MKIGSDGCGESGSVLAWFSRHANTGRSKYAILPVYPNKGDPKEPT